MWNKVYFNNGLGRPRLASAKHRMTSRVTLKTKTWLDSVGHAKIRELIKLAMEDGYDGRS